MIIKLGSTGETVKLVQEKLGIPQTGIFNSTMDTAVKKWQAANSLKPDGIVGPKTLAKLGLSRSTANEQKDLSESNLLNRLKGYVPVDVLTQLSKNSNKIDVNSRVRLAHFLSQCHHESGGFKRVYENLNYSAESLKKLFPKYFPGNLSDTYENKPELIASRIYANRMGNGDEASGDGWRYRGRGYIQLTGKYNYDKFSRYIGEDVVKNPELVATKYPLASAMFFFESNKIWSICDGGADESVIQRVTKKINGGFIGLADRVKYFKKYYELLSIR